MNGAAFHRGESKQDYETPTDFLNAVSGRFGPIAFDLAASQDNTIVEDNYYDESENSLIQPWHELIGTLWLNPPFNRIEPWAHKCAMEAVKGARILFLTPASVDSEWFAMHVWRKALVLAVRPRLSFDGKQPYPKGVMLSCYGFGVGFDLWKWR